MDYISVKEASQRWNISERRVRALCENGRIEGATRCGDWVWSIPSGTQRPADGRTLRYIKNRNLRTGTQDFSLADKIRNSSRSSILTDYQKASVIQEAFAYADINLTKEQILDVFRMKIQDLPLDIQIMILNMRSALSSLPVTVSEKSIAAVNKRILMSVDEENGGKLHQNGIQSQEMEAMLSQYYGSWAILHPVARSAFLFAELVRIDPFVKSGIQTAFVILTSELVKAKLSPAIFGTEHITELKAALASANMRGNSQTLVSMILEASCK